MSLVLSLLRCTVSVLSVALRYDYRPPCSLTAMVGGGRVARAPNYCANSHCRATAHFNDLTQHDDHHHPPPPPPPPPPHRTCAWAGTAPLGRGGCACAEQRGARAAGPHCNTSTAAALDDCSQQSSSSARRLYIRLRVCHQRRRCCCCCGTCGNAISRTGAPCARKIHIDTESEREGGVLRAGGESAGQRCVRRGERERAGQSDY